MRVYVKAQIGLDLGAQRIEHRLLQQLDHRRLVGREQCLAPAAGVSSGCRCHRACQRTRRVDTRVGTVVRHQHVAVQRSTVSRTSQHVRGVPQCGECVRQPTRKHGTLPRLGQVGRDQLARPVAKRAVCRSSSRTGVCYVIIALYHTHIPMPRGELCDAARHAHVQSTFFRCDERLPHTASSATVVHQMHHVPMRRSLTMPSRARCVARAHQQAR
jgi:hypothetical protein